MEEKVVAPKGGTPVTAAPASDKPTVGTPASEPKVEDKSKVEQVQQLSDIPNEQKEVDVDTLIPSDPYYMDPLFYEVANYFGLEQQDYDGAKNKLADIVDYIIRDIKSNAPDAVLLRLAKLERSLQPASWDEKRYTNVHKYVRLAQKQTTITQAMKAFEKEAMK